MLFLLLWACEQDIYLDRLVKASPQNEFSCQLVLRGGTRCTGAGYPTLKGMPGVAIPPLSFSLAALPGETYLMAIL